jgi:hypothetical protein
MLFAAQGLAQGLQGYPHWQLIGPPPGPPQGLGGRPGAAWRHADHLALGDGLPFGTPGPRGAVGARRVPPQAACVGALRSPYYPCLYSPQQRGIQLRQAPQRQLYNFPVWATPEPHIQPCTPGCQPLSCWV